MKQGFRTNRAERTVSLFNDGLNCAQAMITVFGDPYGVDPETACTLGRPWGGGMGRLGRTCGAVTGAIQVLGLACNNGEEGENRDKVSATVAELFRRFETVHGTSLCRDLLGADMSTEEGRKRIKEEDLFSVRCPAFVRTAAEILGELIEA